MTETGMSLGTPHYMSPEQAAGERTLDARTDVYALGCVLYEMLSGRSPHEGPTVAAILVRVLTETPAPLGGLVPGLPPAIEAAVMRALARSPAERFATAGAFAAGLATAPVPSELSDKSIVVLPFDNMSPDPNDAWLSDGLTEELISDLSRIRAFRVISRNSGIAVKQRTRDVREIARLVDVRYVLEGSVRRAGDSLRITAQLIDGASDTHLWTEKYSGTMTDVFAMQESVSRAIVAALEVVLTPDESRRLQQHSIPDVAAYECYLRARQLIYTFSAEPLDRALALLDESEKAAGSSALLLACRGWIHCSRYNNRPSATNPGLKIGLALAERACAEDPSCALAFFVVGWGKDGRADRISRGDPRVPPRHRARPRANGCTGLAVVCPRLLRRGRRGGARRAASGPAGPAGQHACRGRVCHQLLPGTVRGGRATPSRPGPVSQGGLPHRRLARPLRPGAAGPGC